MERWKKCFVGKCGQGNLEQDLYCISCGNDLGRAKSITIETGQDTSKLKQKFPGLTSKSYEHPDDTRALKVLKNIPLMGRLMKQVYKNWHNLNYEVVLTANSVKVTEKHFSQTYEIFKECAQILDLEKIPKFYITQDPDINAYTTGTEDTFLVISSGLIDLMADEELAFIIGHEMGHIKK